MRKLRVGVLGLGRAFSVMLPTFVGDPRVELVAAADPRREALEKFEADFGAKVFDSAEALCAAPEVEVVYIATPHQHHAAQACLAASRGKHVLVEKPMALTLGECRAMSDAARRAGVHLVVGHSHSFDAPILQARKIIDSGAFGAVRMITALNFTDFLYRPRRPEELHTPRGGGAIFNQAAHQVDVVRLLGGGWVKTVRAYAGKWDPARPTEGAYSALLSFADGAFATLSYSGYAHFDSDEFCGWIGELGAKKDPAGYGTARRALQGDEPVLKNARNYGGTAFQPPPRPQAHQHFGLVIVSCERADLRPMPNGIMIYGDAERRFDPLPEPEIPRVEVIDELYEALVNGRAPLHAGEWALATMEVCLGILESSRTEKEVALENQAGLPKR